MAAEDHNRQTSGNLNQVREEVKGVSEERFSIITYMHERKSEGAVVDLASGTELEKRRGSDYGSVRSVLEQSRAGGHWALGRR